jgi:hypothetical protein
MYPDPFGPQWRFPWVRHIMTWEGGIFQMFWIEWLAAITLCSVVVTIAYFALKDNDEVSNYVRSLADMAVFVARRFQAAISLMLGFYMIQNLNRWTNVRNVERNTMGTVNDLALRISWNFRDRVGQEEENETSGDTDKGEIETTSAEEAPRGKPRHSPENVRFQLIRWLNLSHAIAIGELYESRKNAFSSLEKIRDSGLATQAECIFLKTKPHYTFAAPLVWFMDLLDELQKKELLNVDNALINTLAGNILEMRRSLEDLYVFRNTPIPLCYRQLVNVTVRTYMIVLLLSAALTEKLEESEAAPAGRLSRASFFIIFVFAFEYFLFVGWLTVADAVGNPYRSWSDELEWEVYVKALYESSSLYSSGLHDESLHMPEEKGHVTERWNVCLLDPPRIPEGLGKGLKGKRRMLTGF